MIASITLVVCVLCFIIYTYINQMKIAKWWFKCYNIIWTINKKQSVSITFDDAIYKNGKSFKKIIETLNKHKCNATFFIIASYVNVENINLLVSAVKNGHHLANHGKYNTRHAGLTYDELDNELTTCNKLIEKSEQVGFQEAEINIDGAQKMIKMVRNNERIMYQDEEYASFLWQKLQPYIKSEVGNSFATGLNEMFRFYKYNPGQRFKMHRDGSYKRSESEFSYYTFLIYLNDRYEGGETKFASGEIITPKTGTALIFEHSLRHEGARLTSGCKYVLRSDIMYKNKQ